MKKLFILLTAVTVSVFANAKDDLLILESGSLNFWTETGKFATLDIDWSKAQIVEWDKDKVEKEHGTFEEYNRLRGDDYVNDWPNVQRMILLTAPSELNKKNKKSGIKVLTLFDEQTQAAVNNMTPEQKAEWDKSQAKAQKNGIFYGDASQASYDIKISVDSIDLGNGAASAFGMDPHTGGVIIAGTMAVFDRSTNKSVCSIKINHLKGWGSYGETARMQSFFIVLWKEAMPKLLKENGIKIK